MWYGNEKWDKRFLTLAEHIASWSKDPSTKCGAVIVSGKKIISVGYNGFPAGCKDDNALYQNRDRKYLRVIHAEQNAIYTARENLELLECTIYIHPLPPCAQCAAAIIQVGIKRVVAPKIIDKELQKRWNNSIIETNAMFNEAGVLLDLM